DYDDLATMDRSDVRRIIDRSLQRLGMERLDMVQFSWWNYHVNRYVEVAGWLRELQQEGKIELISGTNFNTSSTREILQAGIPLATMQVQYSLLDRRPERGLAPLCAETGMKLLCYGTVAGGFLSERWLGKPDPGQPFENRSLVKYRLVIEDCGGWDWFQSLLTVLDRIARKHRVTIANVAARAILEKAAVGGLIIGAATAEHLEDNLRVFTFELDEEDRGLIRNIQQQSPGMEGDTFDAERDKEGRHGRIMRYNLNKGTS
ncbi:MAG: aldo/keto reductase, partial [Bacteroidota bacterium]